MNGMLQWLNGWLPNSLTKRVTLAMVIITVTAGLITVWAVGYYLSFNLRNELIYSGQALIHNTEDAIEDELRAGDLGAIQKSLSDIVQMNSDVAYALILDKGVPLVQVCEPGFPTDLLKTVVTVTERSAQGILLQTEQGQIRDFSHQPIIGRTFDLHLGISQTRINTVLRKVKVFLVALTLTGCFTAAFLALIFSRIITSSLSELTLSVQRFRAGELDRPIDLPPGGEVGNLAAVFNQMREELFEKEQIRNQLLNQIINAQEEERKRISRELHDGLGQSLNALVFGLNTAGKTVSREPESAIGLLSRLNVSVSETIKELQDIIYDLRPSLLDDHGLIRALDWLADERLRNGGISVSLDTERVLEPIPDIQETTLFRIGQEAITNIRKYAKAKTVRIRLETDGQSVELEIRDDGIGFDPNDVLNVKDKKRGWGLLGMRERASLLCGQLDIESSPGQGTCLRAVLPLGGGRNDKNSNC